MCAKTKTCAATILQYPLALLILGMEELKSRCKSLLLGLAFAYILFTLARLVFLVYNWSFFSTCSRFDILTACFLGVWFDTVPVFYYNLLFIFLLMLPHRWWFNSTFKQVVVWIFVFTNGVALLQNLIDVGYFPFHKKRTGAEIFQLAKELTLPQSYSYLKDFWVIAFFLLALLSLSFFLIRRYALPPFTKRNNLEKKENLLAIWSIYIASCMGITLLGLRGGFGLIPLRTFDAGRFVNTQLVAVASNTPFQFICTVEGNSAPSPNFMPIKIAQNTLNPIKILPPKTFQKKNVVIIIVESLGKEYMGFYNPGKKFTPFLDSLCQVSLTFKNSYANGTTSMDAPPAILAGIPSLLEDSYMVSQFNINSPQSIGSLLSKEGYNSSFYHGGKNGTMSFDNFISLSGSGSYYGLNEYPNKNDYDGKWGIFDEPYLQYYANELSKKKTPFISTVFTLSSHHPYTVPEKYHSTLPHGSLPIHHSIAYTDYSLRLFFQKAQKQTWYANTLFVITADHTSDSENPAYQTTLGRFEIPFIMFAPSDTTLKGKRNNVVQQSLIMPTILDYIGYSKPYFSLSPSALDKKSFAVFYSSGTYLLAKNYLVVAMTPNMGNALYDLRNDKSLNQDISHLYPKEKEKMQELLKAYLQNFFTHMNLNSWKIQ